MLWPDKNLSSEGIICVIVSVASFLALMGLHASCAVAGLLKINPELVIGQTVSPPKIDGMIDDAAWQNTIAVPFADSETARPPREKTQARVTYDRDRLYVAFVCHESRMDQLVAERTRIDDITIYKDDSVELFFLRSGTKYHVMINSAGVYHTDSSQDGSDWNPDIQVATVRGKYCWTVEVSLDFASLGGAPSPGETWRGNFNREHRTNTDSVELSGYSPGPLHQTKYWARLRFEERVLSAKETYSVHGKVVCSGETQKPDFLSYEGVRIVMDSFITAPDSNGEFTFEDVPRGKYELSITKTVIGIAAEPVSRELTVDRDLDVEEPFIIRILNRTYDMIKDRASFIEPQGTRETRVVPDTVDLVGNAEWALNVLTRVNNPDKMGKAYFTGIWSVNPPRLLDDWEEINLKMAEPLTLMRQMTGSLANTDADVRYSNWLLDMPNGFMFRHPPYVGRPLSAISLHYQLSGDPVWKKTGKQVVDQLIAHCPRVEDFAYYPPMFDFQLDPTCTRSIYEYDDEYPTGWPAIGDSWIVQGLCAYYRATGYEPALDLAERMVRHMCYHGKIFGEDGRFLVAHDGWKGPNTAIHVYRHLQALLSIADFALASGKMEYAKFAQRGYEYARTIGVVQIGWFPEYIGAYPNNRDGRENLESCVVAHMVSLALHLTAAGVGDYWEDVDCYIRNMLTEIQLRDTRWAYDKACSYPVTPVAPGDDTSLVMERLVGTFASWAGPNVYAIYGYQTMHCCACNPPRAIYFCWEQMLREEPGLVTIELMLNRDSESVCVKSDLPYAGRVSVFLKKDVALRLRKAAWLDPSTVKVVSRPSGEVVAFEDLGKYLVVPRRSAGEELVFTFDISERTIKEKVGHINATITLRGNEVVHFDPPGEEHPLWQKKDVGVKYVPETLRTYFVPDKRVNFLIDMLEHQH